MIKTKAEVEQPLIVPTVSSVPYIILTNENSLVHPFAKQFLSSRMETKKDWDDCAQTCCDVCNMSVKCVSLKGCHCPKLFPNLYGLSKEDLK